MNNTDTYRYAGPIDTAFSAKVIPADRIKYACDHCGQALEDGVCSRCTPPRRG